MANAQRQKTIMYLTGPVKKVEAELTELPEEWSPINEFHHVIGEQACVTVTLVPTRFLEQMAVRRQIVNDMRAARDGGAR